eukprot:TRINITY_DN22242_c0_g1_i1.p1 TRINITY_DN22242_c0_g1~~TRINITY_DN22242_c0_g1_i1.p1  ORF type:complete len:105 (+),score=25.16 TRINITY_DN22242_c0_g1_i1:51-365(+)
MWTTAANRLPQQYFFFWKQLARNRYFILQKFNNDFVKQEHKYRIILNADANNEKQIALSHSEKDIQDHWKDLEKLMPSLISLPSVSDKDNFVISHIDGISRNKI